VGGMRENAARVMLETVPLFHKVVAAVIADFLDEFAVGVADLAERGAVNHDLAAVRDLLNKARRGIEFLAYDPTLVRQIVDIAGLRGIERVITLLQILQKLVEATRVNILCSEGYSPVLGDNAAIRINQIFSFMRKNLKEDLTLEDAAKHVHMQPRSFSRFFRQITGRRFSDYLREMRVGEACDLLQNTELPITDICFSVGFNNISWFNRCFMESKKVTPREYRRIGLGRYGPFGIFPHVS